MGAYAGKISDTGNPFIVEFAQQMGFDNIELEGDALGIIKKLQSMDTDMSHVGTLIEEAKWEISLHAYWTWCKFGVNSVM